MRLINVLKRVVATACLAAGCMPANGEPMQYEFMIAIQESFSVGSVSFEFQRQAYINVLSSGLIPTDGTFAVGVMTFAYIPNLDFGLRVIQSQQDKDDLIEAIQGLVYSGGSNNTGNAINFASQQLAAFDFADDEIISVSTDGASGVGSSVDDANALGQQVNCVAIDFFVANSNPICDWNNRGRDFTVTTMAQLEGAVAAQFAACSCQPVSNPATWALFGVGFFSMASAQRRRRKQV